MRSTSRPIGRCSAPGSATSSATRPRRVRSTSRRPRPVGCWSWGDPSVRVPGPDISVRVYGYARAVIVDVGRSLREGFFMFWETLWPLVLGFGLSGAVQAFVPREQLERAMGDHGPTSVVRASG